MFDIKRLYAKMPTALNLPYTINPELFKQYSYEDNYIGKKFYESIVLFKANKPSISIYEKIKTYLENNLVFKLTLMDNVMLGFCLQKAILSKYFDDFQLIQAGMLSKVNKKIIQEIIADVNFRKMFMAYDQTAYTLKFLPQNGLDKYVDKANLQIYYVNENHMDILINPEAFNDISKVINHLLKQ